MKQLGTNRTKYDIRQPLGLAVPILRQVKKNTGFSNLSQQVYTKNRDISLNKSHDEQNEEEQQSHMTHPHDTDFTVEQHSSRGRIGQYQP